ncbi:MAG: CRISPR system precrRNA processing endoribonuclease RAMP protein Cas6 [Clostridium sp.]|nr:CRISPR system precrRNA processing endoribonuclease RAMP protein Cas6 [Acetatifactor muris]MCM1527273.1 CRISPR system precrRNA processing endoribonuclease RAMP protein Cas6 [Bacteroides sp.]MCM1563033.1 CRISPR system precrRNA processing endoribonuclease RAMP protein Cas6 [Clostridium sp.]
MNIREMEEALRIRYVKLHFTIRFREDARLPVNKVSAIRGGIGEMLLRDNCVRDRDCENCDFEEECIVRRTLYSKFDQKPAFVTTGESAGYVLECENYEEFFPSGETLGFQLILFGKTIVYFSRFLQAVLQLGMAGLGREHAGYDLVSLRNTRGEEILEGENILMGRYRIQTVGDYVRYRMAQDNIRENRIVFKTPVTLKYRGVYQEKPDPEMVVTAVFRRLYILDCFENLHCGELRWQGEYPEVAESDFRPMTVRRYSGTHNRKLILSGVKGQMRLAEIPEELLPVLLAGEILHIGKNTSFGFGRYRLR